MNNVYVLLEIAKADKTGWVFRALLIASKPFHDLIKKNAHFAATLRDSFLIRTESVVVSPYWGPGGNRVQYQERETLVTYRDFNGRYHRELGPAFERFPKPGCVLRAGLPVAEWRYRGELHRVGGPATVTHEHFTISEWWEHGVRIKREVTGPWGAKDKVKKRGPGPSFFSPKSRTNEKKE